MALKRETSVGVGLAVMGLSWAVYTQVTPRVADLRVSRPNEVNALAAEKTARWTAGAIVVGVSLVTRDATVFIMGGIMVVALSWMHRQANMVNPATAGAFAPIAPGIHIADGMPAGRAAA
jgi:hypothetical protein